MNVADLYRGMTPVSPRTETGVPERTPGAGSPKPGSAGPSEFEILLRGNTASPGAGTGAQKLALSQHAETRIKSRSIPWSPALENRISGGIDAAEKKGSREALILADDVAVIANVKTRTIVTAMDRHQMKEKVFTNIDSAVLV